KIPLPATEQDDEVRRKALDIAFRCLMRIKGAYAASRSTGFEGAAARAAGDLRTAYDQLYFIHRTADRSTELLKRSRQAQKEAAEPGGKAVGDEVAKERRLREEEAARFAERLKEAAQEKNVLQRAAAAAIERAAKAAQEKDALVAQKEQVEQQL